MVLFKISAHLSKSRLDSGRIISANLRHVFSQQRAARFTTNQGNVAHVPLKLTAVDLCLAEGAGADRISLQGRAAARAVQRCRLRWWRREHVSLALELPTFVNVVAHFHL